MTITRILAAAAIVIALAHSQTPSFRPRELVYRDDFLHGLDQWTQELEKPGRVDAKGGTLSIDVPAGATIWFKPKLQGPVMIRYQATMIKAGGPNDRVSDLNCFWMASDSRSPDDLFATKRSGKFADYNALRTYYVGQGGNGNTTTRFRRYIGSVDQRPLLPQHDLRAALLTPNIAQIIQLVAFDKHIQYRLDGKVIFDFTDQNPYTQGHFAFRTTDSHIEIRKFQVFRLALVPGLSPSNTGPKAPR